MKHIYIIVAILFFIAPMGAEGKPCPKCVVDELMKELPTDNPRVLKTQMRRLALVPKDGLWLIALRFQPVGKGDNSTLEFALTAFVNYVRDKDKAKLTEEAKEAFFNAVPKCHGAENKGFLLTLAALLCTEEDIPRFEPYLENKALAPYAESAVGYIKRGQ